MQLVFLQAWVLSLLISLTSSLPARIIGGNEASIVAFPYQASVQYEGMHICGGAIASPKFIITAAHCLYGLNKDLMRIAAGSTLASRGLGEVRQVWTFKIHDQYNDDKTDNDIGIIKIIGIFNFGYTLQPIPIANQNDPLPTGSWASVSGWGYLKETGNIVKALRQAKIPIVDRTICKKQYINVGTISDNMICAGMSGRDACQGDSGGPLVFRGKLIGLVSWGYGCARVNYPGIYTKVANFNNWILLNMLTM